MYTDDTDDDTDEDVDPIPCSVELTGNLVNVTCDKETNMRVNDFKALEVALSNLLAALDMKHFEPTPGDDRYVTACVSWIEGNKECTASSSFGWY